MKYVLGLETTSAVCSVGIVDEQGREFERKLVESHVHSEKILTLVAEVCEQARVLLNDCSSIAVSIGPGSFTGLRIGVSTAKGLAFSMGKHIVAVPTFEAMALEASRTLGTNAVRVAVCIDAKQGDWYWQKFDIDGTRIKPLQSVAMQTFGGVHEECEDVAILITDKPGSFPRLERCEVRVAEPLFSGAAVARIGVERNARAEFANASALEPMYLKDFIVRTAAKPVLQ